MSDWYYDTADEDRQDASERKRSIEEIGGDPEDLGIDVAPEMPRAPRLELTLEMIEAMLSAPDLEAAMGSTAADMVEGGWSYPEAMVAIAVAFGERLRSERLKHAALVRAAAEGRAIFEQRCAVLEEYATPEAFLR